MIWTLVYFDDQLQNIECYQMLLKDKYKVIGCQDVTRYSEIMEQNKPHAYLLDVHMPIMDGYALYEKIIRNEHYNGCPIIFISGDLCDDTKMRSYDYGGLDFLNREMRAEEVDGRISSKIKLYLKNTSKLDLGNLRIDFESLRVQVDREPIDITLYEMRILSCLLRNMGETLTRDEVLKRVWGEELNSRAGTINTHISSIKSKLQRWDHTIQIRQDNILISLKHQ